MRLEHLFMALLVVICLGVFWLSIEGERQNRRDYAEWRARKGKDE